jgi:Protein of unknown function (DUF429)
MPTDQETPASPSAVYGRAPAPQVALPTRGTVIGLCWSGAEGAGNQIVAAKLELSPDRPRLSKVWRPFTEAPGRRDIRERFAPWIAEESRWAEGKLVVGVDFALSLAETHLRQLGLLRQALKGPTALGRQFEERFLTEAGDFTAGAARFREELGKDRPRVTDCYRAELYTPASARAHRRTFFGLVTLARLTAGFPPWDPPRPGVPTVVEVRPGHVARALCGVNALRDDVHDDVSRASIRAGVLRMLRAAARLEFEMELAAPIVEDGSGDHLDAVLAAVAAASAWEQGFQGVPSNVPRCEGWIHSIPEESWRHR